jgi:BASS family bile acid:Na+ symporter
VSIDLLLDATLKVSLVVFMAGSLLGMGLGLRFSDAMVGLRDWRFLGCAAAHGFVVSAAIGWGLTRLLPLAEPHATGLMLIALTPCAPFLPMMVERAKGDMTYAPAMMLLAAVGTVAVLPVAAPLLAPGLAVDAWTIARPLVAIVLVPLVVGMIVFRRAPGFAAAARPLVKKSAGIAAVILLALCLVLYGQSFVEMLGQFAIAAYVLFFGLTTATAWAMSPGLTRPRRSVLGLGVCTRNAGAAIAPLFAAPAADPRAIVMVALAVPLQIAAALLWARWFARDDASRG